MQKKSKVALVVPSSAKKAYQDLANKYSAIEPPTWALLIAQALRVSGYDPIIFDYDADPKDDETAAQEIYDEKPVLAVFVLYGQNPNSGTTMMIGAASLASTLKSQYADLKIGFVGSHPSALPQEVIQLPYVDFAFHFPLAISLVVSLPWFSPRIVSPILHYHMCTFALASRALNLIVRWRPFHIWRARN